MALVSSALNYQCSVTSVEHIEYPGVVYSADDSADAYCLCVYAEHYYSEVISRRDCDSF